MSSLDYYSISNGPAVTQHSEDSFITYCLTLSFILLCVFPVVTYFKDSILRTLLCIRDGIHCISIYVAYIFNILFELYTTWKELKQLQPQDQCFQQPRTRKTFIKIPSPLDEFLIEVMEQLIILIQTSPRLDEFFTEVKEQLTISSSTKQTSSNQDIQQEYSNSQVFQTEQSLLLHTPNGTHTPPVVCNDQAFTEFIQGEERYLKFINQDLTFLKSSSIPPTFSNISKAVNASAKAKESTHIQLLTHAPQDHIDSPPTQTIEPVLGFTLAEVCQAQAEPKLTVQQILEIKSCQDYVKTPLQTLDSIYVNQPKRFLPLAKEAKKLAEEFRKEIALQWAGIPHEKLLQESFMEQLNPSKVWIN